MLLSLQNYSCFSGGNDDADLESLDLDQATATVEPEKKELSEREASEQGVKEAGDAKKHDWKSLFKPAPTVKERQILTRALRVQSDPEDSEGLLAQARKELALGQLEKAAKSYRQVVRLQTENIQAYLELAMIFVRKGELSEAFNWLEEIKQKINDREVIATSFIFHYRYTLALAYIKAHNRQKGHSILSDLIAIDKDFLPGYAALASSYLSEGKLEVAEFIVKRGLDRGKDDSSLFNLLGVISERSGLLEKASSWYDKSIVLAPTFTPALINKGILALKQFDYDEAEKILKQALSYNPSSIEAHTALGIVYIKIGSYSLAKTILEKSVDLAPQNPAPRYNLGLLNLHALNMPFEAMRLFHEVIQSSTEKNKNLKELAKSYIDDIKYTNNYQNKN